MKYTAVHIRGRWRVCLEWNAEVGGGSEEVFVGIDREQAMMVQDALNEYVRRHGPPVRRPDSPLQKLA